MCLCNLNFLFCGATGKAYARTRARARPSSEERALKGRDRGKCDNKPGPKAPIDLSFSQFLLLSWDQMALAPSWRHSLPSLRRRRPPPMRLTVRSLLLSYTSPVTPRSDERNRLTLKEKILGKEG